MEEDMQHFLSIVLYYFKEGKNATEMLKKICSVYGGGTVTELMCQKWFVKFHARDFSLDDVPQLGRLVEVDREQVETLIENSQCYTMREIADILKISKSIKLLVKVKNVFYLAEKTKQTFWPIQYWGYHLVFHFALAIEVWAPGTKTQVQR